MIVLSLPEHSESKYKINHLDADGAENPAEVGRTPKSVKGLMVGLPTSMMPTIIIN